MTPRASIAGFEQFVQDNWAGLMRVGVAVTGSRHEAEDLVQEALTRSFARWGHIRAEDRLAYVRRSIVNANISRWRRHRGRELTLETLPEDAHDSGSATLDRLSLLPLLRQLPPKQQAVLVLRYLCDLDDAQIAATMRISSSTVRSQAARGLATLRRAAPARDLVTELVPSPKEDRS